MDITFNCCNISSALKLTKSIRKEKNLREFSFINFNNSNLRNRKFKILPEFLFRVRFGGLVPALLILWMRYWIFYLYFYFIQWQNEDEVGIFLVPMYMDEQCKDRMPTDCVLHYCKSFTFYKQNLAIN